MASAAKTNKPISINLAHCSFGYGDEHITREIARALGFEITNGTMKPCDACAAAKAKQKNLPTGRNHIPSKISNERMHLDIATIKAPEHMKINVSKPHWRILVDEKVQMKISDFYATKNGMIEPTCEKFQKWNDADMPVRIVRMDGSGENMKLKQRSESSDWKLGIEYEITARNTPQQNHLAEIALTVIANRGRALMHNANVPEKLTTSYFAKHLAQQHI